MTLIPSSGNPNLYVKVYSDDNLDVELADRPTLQDFDVKSQDSIGADTALITGDLANKCSQSCVILLGVHALD